MSSLSLSSSSENYANQLKLSQQNNEFQTIGTSTIRDKLTGNKIDVKIVSLIKSKTSLDAFKVMDYDKNFMGYSSGVFQVLDNEKYILGSALFSELVYKDGVYGGGEDNYYRQFTPIEYGDTADKLKNVSQIFLDRLASYVNKFFSGTGNILMHCLFAHSLNKGYEMRVSLITAFGSAIFYRRFNMLALDPYKNGKMNNALLALSQKKRGELTDQESYTCNSRIMYFPVGDSDQRAKVNSVIYRSPIIHATSVIFRQILGPILKDSRAQDAVVQDKCMDLIWDYL